MSGAVTFNDAVDAFQRGDLERARSLAQEAVDAEPSAKLQHLLGLIDCRSGRLESGIDWLRKSCEAEPDNLGFRVMLARALVDDGRGKEALEVAVAPKGTTPPELALWQARGEAAQSIRDFGISAEAWQVVCTARPNDWRAWANLGQALAELGQRTGGA